MSPSRSSDWCISPQTARHPNPHPNPIATEPEDCIPGDATSKIGPWRLHARGPDPFAACAAAAHIRTRLSWESYCTGSTQKQTCAEIACSGDSQGRTCSMTTAVVPHLDIRGVHGVIHGVLHGTDLICTGTCLGDYCRCSYLPTQKPVRCLESVWALSHWVGAAGAAHAGGDGAATRVGFTAECKGAGFYCQGDAGLPVDVGGPLLSARWRSITQTLKLREHGSYHEICSEIRADGVAGCKTAQNGSLRAALLHYFIRQSLQIYLSIRSNTRLITYNVKSELEMVF